MDTDGMVIEVIGLPDIDPNSMIDRLTVHFLRRSNKGGDVLTVIYPTSTKYQAYVVFESAEVPGVLEHNHLLEVEGQFYPLDVKSVHRPQLDMPVEASLNVNMFSSQRAIQNLLESYGFKVSEPRSGELHLEGSFFRLKLIRPKLMQLQAQETRVQRRTPSPYTNSYSNGSVSKYRPNDYESIPKSTSRHNHANGNSMYAGASSPSTARTSRSPESPNSLPLFQPASPLAGSSSSGGSFCSPSRFSEYSNASWKSPSPRQTEFCFSVEPDVFRYTVCFEKEFIKKIESDHSTHIKHDDNSEFFTVRLLGGACKEAGKKLSYFMQDIASSLRTQEIELNKFDISQQRLIAHDIYRLKDIYKVLIWQERDVIKVVGSSKDSYEVKQRLLGHEVDIPVPSQLARNSQLRRSNSLPRQKTRTKTENVSSRRSPDTVLQDATSSSSASQSQSGRDLQQDRGRQLSKPTAQHSRPRSTSEFRNKNQNRVDRPLPTDDQQDLTPPSGVKTSKQRPAPKIVPSFQINFDDIKSKFHKNQRSQIFKV
ncbi:uncharacterized protein LOC127421561 [Myxocyprinus asiaticus]|uniref:uncharacterized protein LOC127421561 n=1 Tax=Myxocyprinus asiaticus TaxID=70543 RepID=UPI0022226544|nr:uncharacterized protein LOC127421561 [Myxocyprinus asiaticus]